VNTLQDCEGEVLLALTRRADVLSGLTRFHADPGSDTPPARRKIEDEIEVPFAGPAECPRPTAKREAELPGWLHCRRRMAAIALQQTIPANFPNHFARILV